MKSLALGVVAFGLLLATAAPSLARPPVVYHPVHVYAGPYYRGPVVVVPVPVYSYATYPAAVPVAPPVVAPVVSPVAMAPYYQINPGVSVGIRAPHVTVRVVP